METYGHGEGAAGGGGDTVSDPLGDKDGGDGHGGCYEGRQSINTVTAE